MLYREKITKKLFLEFAKAEKVNNKEKKIVKLEDKTLTSKFFLFLFFNFIFISIIYIYTKLVLWSFNLQYIYIANLITECKKETIYYLSPIVLT